VVSLVWVARLDLLPQGFKIWIAQPLMPLFGIIAPPHFRLLKEAYQADDPKRLAQGSQTRLAHLCERHGLSMHGDIISKSQANGCAPHTRRGAVWRCGARDS